MPITPLDGLCCMYCGYRVLYMGGFYFARVDGLWTCAPTLDQLEMMMGWM